MIPVETIARDLEEAQRYLSRLPGVTRVWLFGSAGQGKRALDWRSDLDFAVEGLGPDDLWCAWSELDARLRMPVDLVRWEDASGFLKSEIAKGKVLWESLP